MFHFSSFWRRFARSALHWFHLLCGFLPHAALAADDHVLGRIGLRGARPASRLCLWPNCWETHPRDGEAHPIAVLPAGNRGPGANPNPPEDIFMFGTVWGEEHV